MRTFAFALFGLLSVATLAQAAEPAGGILIDAATARTASPVPSDFSVFVDPATGFTFVKTPKGWKFRGQLPAERLDSLPAGTYTRLIAPVSVGTGS